MDFADNIKEMYSFKNIKIIKHNVALSNVYIYLTQPIDIKMITDFNKYCYIEPDYHNFNLKIINYPKSPENIIKILCDIKILTPYIDHFHIFKKVNSYHKVDIDYHKLSNQLNDYKFKKNLSDIPTELLFSQKQIVKMIINEIKSVNTNTEHPHIIIPDYEAYHFYIKLKVDSHIAEKLKSNYLELKMEFTEARLYPYYPPKIEYKAKDLKLPLLFAINNLNILKFKNWNSTLTLNHLIMELHKQLEPLILDNIQDNISELDNYLIDLVLLTKEIENPININIDISKMTLSKKTYWNAGTGFGYNELKDWDINNYLIEQKLYMEQLRKILIDINKELELNNNIKNPILTNFIIKQINGLTILEIENNKKLYLEIFKIFSYFLDNNYDLAIDKYYDNLENLYYGLESLLKSTYQEIDTIFKAEDKEIILQIYWVLETFIHKYKKVSIIEISDDVKNNYCNIMKKLQFDNYNIPEYHLFKEHINNKPSQKALKRMLTEISSFKNSLPLSWESSIWIRVSKTNLHLFTFLISGPENTPYENGLFEFHAYLPPNYPNETPEVLLQTTGNQTFRFNPNLYSSGKVCLSLLGTWAGQTSESWNPSTSTFLQVMISIQSLIFVDDPYFNEPGHEKLINTEKGKTNSLYYNRNIYPKTIELGMIDMIKNPPNGFEQIIKEYFKLKKDQIINKINTWGTFKETTELIKLLNNL